MDDASNQDPIFDRFRQRVARRVALVRALRWGTVYLLGAGTAALVLRAAFGIPPERLLWGGAGLLAVAVAAGISALRERPDPSAVRAWLDRAGGAGGLLMAGAEVPLGAWQERLGPLPDLPLQSRGGRSGWVCLGATAYLAACLLLPVTRAGEAMPRPLDLQREVAALTEQVEQLEALEAVDEATADALKDQLAEIAEEAAGDRPAESWEALDALARQAENLAAEAAEEAMARREALAMAAEMAEGLAAAAETGAEVTAAAQELAELARQAAAADAQMAAMAELAGLLDPAGGQGALQLDSAAALRQLAEHLSNASREQLERLQQLAEAGQLPPGIDPEMLRQAAEAAAGRGEADDALLAYLEENAGSSLTAALVQCQASGSCSLGPGEMGRGGVQRGPGAAPMTWKEPTAEGNTRFQEVALPPAAVAALGRQFLLGMSVADPSTAEGTAAAPTAAPAALPAGEGAAVVRELLPQHRGAVRRYFERAPQGVPQGRTEGETP
jgi:hypothetical protein